MDWAVVNGYNIGDKLWSLKSECESSLGTPGSRLAVTKNPRYPPKGVSHRMTDKSCFLHAVALHERCNIQRHFHVIMFQAMARLPMITKILCSVSLKVTTF